jgi:hypothetical protein
MYGQAKKSYLNMIRYIDKTTKTVDKPVKSTGLLGKKMGSAPQTDTTKQEPKDKVAKLVSDIRKARMEIKNGREPITND